MLHAIDPFSLMISDTSFVDAKLSELEGLLAGAEATTEKAYDIVKGKVG